MDNRNRPPQETSGPTSAARRDPADRHAVLTGILRDTRRALKNRNLYSHIDGHGAEQLALAHQKLSQLLDAFPDIPLRVGVATLYWGDQAVFEDDARDLNLVFPLFHAGVRRLNFRRGLPLQDFVAFWSTTAAELTYEGPEDLLTRLWKCGIEHITWVAHAEIADLDHDGTFTMQVLAMGVQEMRTRPGVDIQMQVARDQMAAVYARQQQRCAELGLPMMVDPSAARSVLDQELGSERQRVLVGVGRSLLDIALIETYPEAGEYLAAGFEQTADALLAEGRLAHVCALADQAAEVSSKQVGEVQRQALAFAVNGLARAVRRPEARPKITALSTEGTNIPVTAFQSLARLLVAGGCAPALQFLDDPIAPAMRAALYKAMAQWGFADVQAISRKAKAADDRQAIALLDVIAAMPLQMRGQVLEPVLQHASVHVRRRAIRAIADSNEGSAGATVLGRHLERCSEPAERQDVFEALARHDCIESERAIAKWFQAQQPPLRVEDLTPGWAALLRLGSSTSMEMLLAATRSVTRSLLGAKDEAAKAALVEAAGAVATSRAVQVLNAIVQTPDASSKALLRRAQDLLAGMQGAKGVKA